MNLKRKMQYEGVDESFSKYQRSYWYYVLEEESEQPTDEDTESVHSIQEKETDCAKDTSDTSSDTDWSDDVTMKLEYEVASLSEKENPLGDGSLSSDTDAIICASGVVVLCEEDISLFADSSEDSDSSLIIDPEVPRADYWTCVQCKNKNNNPLFRYCEKCYKRQLCVQCKRCKRFPFFPLCETCFKLRKDFFPPRPRRKKKKKQASKRPHPSSSLGKTTSTASTVATTSQHAFTKGEYSSLSSSEDETVHLFPSNLNNNLTSNDQKKDGNIASPSISSWNICLSNNKEIMVVEDNGGNPSTSSSHLRKNIVLKDVSIDVPSTSGLNLSNNSQKTVLKTNSATRLLENNFNGSLTRSQKTVILKDEVIVAGTSACQKDNLSISQKYEVQKDVASIAGPSNKQLGNSEEYIIQKDNARVDGLSDGQLNSLSGSSLNCKMPKDDISVVGPSSRQLNRCLSSSSQMCMVQKDTTNTISSVNLSNGCVSSTSKKNNVMLEKKSSYMNCSLSNAEKIVVLQNKVTVNGLLSTHLNNCLSKTVPENKLKSKPDITDFSASSVNQNVSSTNQEGEVLRDEVIVDQSEVVKDEEIDNTSSLLSHTDSGLGSSQDSVVGSSQESCTDGTSISRGNEVCITCMVSPKTGIFVHGKIGHICCCYKCALKIWTETRRCPICNCRVSNVLKGIVQ